MAAPSPANIWAVGITGVQPLIEHWNGCAWHAEQIPNLSGPHNASPLLAVATKSSTTTWTVGFYFNVTAHQTQTLAVHCS